jgi:cytochrome d ubiquinol oxidase subunit II
MMDYATLKVLAWLLVGLMLVGFAIMDGHDLGVTSLLPFVGRSDEERRVVINTVGPHWEGNQVWFIAGGATIFAAWPLVYAVVFSGFYWAMLAVLWTLFLRPVGFTFRSKLSHPQWRTLWDTCLCVAGVVPALLFGVAFGNLLQGVPFQLNAFLVPTYSGSVWDLLNPLGLLSGMVSLAMLTLQGGTYLVHRTEGAIQQRAVTACAAAATLLAASFVTAGLYLYGGDVQGYAITSAVNASALADPVSKVVARSPGAWWLNYQNHPMLWALPAMVLGGALGAAVWCRKSAHTHPASSLTVWDSAASPSSLKLLLGFAVIFLPIIMLYTRWAYRVMRGKVTLAQIHAHGKTLY